MAGLLQPAALPGRAPILPDDGVVDGNTGAPIPQQRGLALVGDSKGGHRAPLLAQASESFAGGGKCRGPDHLGVVLHPAGFRVDLLEGLLLEREDGARGGKADGAAGAGALVDGQQCAVHQKPVAMRSPIAVSCRLVRASPAMAWYSTNAAMPCGNCAETPPDQLK